MGLRETVIRLEGKSADINRRLLGNHERLAFLKRPGETGTKWTVLLEPTFGWDVVWNEFRGQMRVRYATVNNLFADTIAQTSHVAYGVPVGGQIDVFSIDPDRRDVVPPSGESPFWKVYVTRDPKLRWTPAVPYDILTDPLNVIVENCGIPGLIGPYKAMGTHNGKTFYALNGDPGDPSFDEVSGFYWGGSTWALTSHPLAGTQYYSFDDVEFPYQVVNWEMFGNILPLPTVVQAG